MAQKIVAGNWKMNLDKEGSQKLTSEIVNMAKDEVPTDVTMVLCVPFVHISTVRSLVPTGKNLFVGAQNCYTKPSGAYTGEVSAGMLKSYGVEYVILGHSERRQYFKESHAELADKTNIVLEHGMKPIFCIGELLEERKAGKLYDVVRGQIEDSLFHLSAEQFAQVVLAYEPVWAIGTGVVATSDQAQEMHAFIRQLVADKYGDQAAAATSILYGGSAKPDNAQELFACADVDGGLIGGASLKSRDFIDIAKSY